MAESTTPPQRRRRADSIRAEAEFRARLAELGVTLLEPTYLGNNKPHRVRCAGGHEVTTSPSSVRRGWGVCRICAGLDRGAAEAAFRARLAELGATLLEPAYLGSNKPHRVRCAEGHECAPWPADLARGTGLCKTCAKQDPKAAEAAFRARVNSLGGTVLDAGWQGVRARYRVRCAEGHETTPLAQDVQRGGGICAVCAKVDPKAAEARFRARLVELGAVLLEDGWRGTNTTYRVRCAEGHDLAVRPSNLVDGGMCRRCSGKSWDVFYVVADEVADVVKLGITSGSARDRLGAHARDGLDTLVRLHTGLLGDTAPELERVILAALEEAGERPVRGREYFPGRALPLILDLVDHHPAIRAQGAEALTG